jgi:hypothetical protein
MLSRRRFLSSSSLALVGTSTISGRIQAASIPEAPSMKATTMQPRSSHWAVLTTNRSQVRIFVPNKLPEPTTVHWHGMLVPSGMDGVGGLTQPHRYGKRGPRSQPAHWQVGVGLRSSHRDTSLGFFIQYSACYLTNPALRPRMKEPPKPILAAR